MSNNKSSLMDDEKQKNQKYSEGQLVRFKAFSVLSGDHEEMGKIECEGTEGIARGIVDKAEYGDLKRDEAFIIKNKDLYRNTRHHLVFREDIIQVLTDGDQ